MTAAPSPRTTGRALDELGALDDEQATLLRSLSDLDAEHAAGDLDDADYAAIRDDYVARAAAVIRQRADLEAGIDERVQAARSTSPKWRTPVAAVATVLAAVGAGIAVARFAGERVGDQGLTGTVNAAGANRSAEVARLLKQAQDQLATNAFSSLKSYDSVLAIDPQNPEAIAYGGWLLRIVAQSADGEQRDLLINRAKARLDSAVDAAPDYPDARAFRGILLLRDLDDPVAASKDFDALDALDPPPFVTQLVASAREDAAAATTSPVTTTQP
jgi:negative regulator of sigma E activity